MNFLFRKLHKELNQVNNTALIKQQSYEVNSYNKEEAFKIFFNSLIQRNKSIILDYFFGVMKTKTMCAQCQKPKYSFNHFYYISFNIDLAEKKNYNQLSIESLFIIQNDICITINRNNLNNCNDCKKIKEQYQRKQFYYLPYYLIINLERGNNCKNKRKINYNLNLDLTRQSDRPGRIYQLIGIIKRLDKNEKEHYISLYFDYIMQSWVLRDGSSLTKINSPFDHNQ